MTTRDDILSALSASRRTPSVVTLAADLWGGDDPGIDVIGLYTMVLFNLSDDGLVTFSLKNANRPYDQLPCDIRLTQAGWTAAGFPTVTGEAGAPSRHMTPPRHPGDRTDYKTHHSTSSERYDVERSVVRAHDEVYPTHFHQHTDYDDPLDLLGQWRCIRCGGPMLREGRCLFGCPRRDSEPSTTPHDD